MLDRKEFSDLDITIITFVSGLINSILTSPIWFINTRMAISSEKKGIWQTTKEVYQTEGLLAFYKGVLPNLILVINPVINFVIYEGLKKFLLKRNYRVGTGVLMLISSIAKTIATFATYPFLTLRVRMQAEKEKRRCGVLMSILKLCKELGFAGLYMGVYAKLFQTVLYNAFLMVTYEKLRLGIKFLLLAYLRKRHVVQDN